MNKGSNFTEGDFENNQGHTAARYSNLDRSRNTQGKEGGPFPFSMYYKPSVEDEDISELKPKVYYIDMLLKNYFNSGETITIEAKSAK